MAGSAKKAKLREQAAVHRLQRRLEKTLGPRAKGSYVAVDRETGAYFVAKTLRLLMGKILATRPLEQESDFAFLRLGYPVAFHMRQR